MVRPVIRDVRSANRPVARRVRVETSERQSDLSATGRDFYIVRGVFRARESVRLARHSYSTGVRSRQAMPRCDGRTASAPRRSELTYIE